MGLDHRPTFGATDRQIVALTNTDADAAVHHVQANYDTIFTWDYEKGTRPKLSRLYEKAKTSMWNAQTDLPWDTRSIRSGC